jgi:fucose permease
LAARGLLLALAGVSVLLLARRIEILLAGVILAGAGMAPVFPSIVALFQHRVAGSSSALIGRVFAFGGLGGAVFPWLVGSISTAKGSLSSGLLTAALALAALALVLAVETRALQSRPGNPAPADCRR